MISIILSGHGNFGTGVYSSLKLIAGEQEKFEVVDFNEGMSSEDLSHILIKSIDRLESKDGIVIFTDIPGGTPFKEAVILSSKREDIHVIAGTNLPILLDGIFKRELPLEEFVDSVIDSGKNGIISFKDNSMTNISNNNDEDGI